ncbi:hypothetical protein HJC23_009709 [Cyclotella cryptica]|uniref:Trs120/TRAPPC9 N-terminal domain-containing protein n=1 Tax=Cyclotella cryptica TaxID=29204 RepID=A0ABD3Q8B6_9STRA|eukprot:CCRYP_007692-RA/>CCRYP_007692-RA protein AED:0.06 eAED:0.06 QI:357/1/1/1/0.90/0.83/12/479/1736
MYSQLPGNPSFRDAAMHAVAIVPLTIPLRNDATKDTEGDPGSNTTTKSPGANMTHSEKSFYNLLQSLKEFASQNRLTHQRSSAQQKHHDSSSSPSSPSPVSQWTEESSQITLILPHSQLTRPGDWKYENTPLKSHDWRSGCQRVRIFDGRPEFGRMAHDRIGRKDQDDGTITYFNDPWKDLEPHRSTAAVIGVLNMKDCRDTADLWRAEENLIQWARRYSHPLDREDIAIGAGDTRNVLFRLFVFDSFEEAIQQRVNLNQTRFQSSQLVAFPPLDVSAQSHSHMMTLHWNVVVNDLAVALFRNVERRIRENDAAGKSVWKGGVGSSGLSDSKTISDGLSASIRFGNDETPTTASMIGAVPNDGFEDATPRGVGGRFKNALDLTRKAIVNRQESTGGKGSGGVSEGSTSGSERGADRRLGLSTGKLVTPLDLDANDALTFSARDMEALKRRDLGRREKRSADLSLLAGSPIDAYERFTRAAELTRHSHDPLWYASALEGCACAFIAMADAGGHGVDEYLESNFQLPEEVMALAIAQGVASGADLGDGRGKTMTVDRTKTTMPQAVTALVEEALSVLCRHEKLAALHAGLLFKLAAYVQDDEEGHLRCRWGEGEFCYGGDSTSNSISGESTVPRWERTSVSRLNLQGTEVRGMLALDSIERGRKFTELLHRAASVGGLDDRSRADVACLCARSCLVGIKETQWGGCDSLEKSRLRFPRKAAFFTMIAAEAMSRCYDHDAGSRASNLYLAASQLYSRVGNEFEHGGDKITRYGWATLRSETLQGLSSQPSDMLVAEAATELLMALLSEISPEQLHGNLLLGQLPEEGEQAVVENYQNSFEQENKTFPDDSFHGKDGTPLNVTKTKQVSKPLASMTAKTPFFSQAPPSALSLSQSKWLEEDPISHVYLPLGPMPEPGVAVEKEFAARVAALSSSVNAMKCVRTMTPFNLCARMQQLCVDHIQDIRQQMAASSAGEVGPCFLPPPLVVTSAKIVKAESHLLLERTKALGYSAKFATHSMSTFFNPYAKNKSDKEKNKFLPTLIAEGEERTIMIEFKNRLAVPLEVPSCVLEFDGKGSIEAPPLSFTVPAKTNSFAVHFPFIISVAKSNRVAHSEGTNSKEVDTNTDPNLFAVSGVRVTCLNRTFPIYFRKGEGDNTADVTSHETQLPAEASRYQRSKHTQPAYDEQQMVVQLESVPAQPNLLVSFANSQSPMEEDANVPIHLSDGEIYTIPPFRLENDFGRSGMGEIERLQVLAVGLPGIPDETLFDTDALAASLEKEEDVLTESDEERVDEEDFEEMMECDGLPPLKMKVIAEGLNLRSINDKSKNKGEGSIVTFQIAATHDMGDQLANGGNVRIRFRYRGPSSNAATEIWRKREISLRIIKVKGPRISSLTFRSDLSWGSSYSELCKSLSIQRRRLDAASKWDNSHSRHRALSRSRSFGSKSDIVSELIESVDELGEYSILNRVGKDCGVHVSSDEVVLLVAVANETNSTIILSNRKGLVGGFEGSPMPTVKVTSGVSVKIPVVIPRIDRIDENGEVTDIAAELVTRTALQWESEVVEGADGTEKIKRTGRVRIPSRCLREIIDEHKSFASRICKPPVSVRVRIDSSETQTENIVSIGSAIRVDADVFIQDWVPRDVLSKCKVMLEFCCAEKQPSNTLHSTNGRMPYVWCGQLRRTVDITNSNDNKSHCARIAFFHSGVFVVSACAKVSSQDSGGNEECWWAPHAITIRVEEKDPSCSN